MGYLVSTDCAEGGVRYSYVTSPLPVRLLSLKVLWRVSNNTMKYISIITIAVATITPFSFCITKMAHADTVSNTFFVTSHSGGNTAKDGEILTGTTGSSIDIRTTINGDVVEDFHKTASKGSLYVEHTVVTSSSETGNTLDTQKPEPHEAREVFESQTTSHLDDATTLNPSRVTITSNHETRIATSTIVGKENTEHPSPFERFFLAVSKTLAYVLSNIFS